MRNLTLKDPSIEQISHFQALWQIPEQKFDNFLFEFDWSSPTQICLRGGRSGVNANTGTYKNQNRDNHWRHDPIWDDPEDFFNKKFFILCDGTFYQYLFYHFPSIRQDQYDPDLKFHPLSRIFDIHLKQPEIYFHKIF